MKQILIVLFLFFSIYFSFSQTTFPWSGTYGGAGASRTYTTTVSGTTMSATIVNSENVFTDSSPLYIAAGGVPPGSNCSGITATNQGMLIYTDWTSNATKTISVTITFSPAVVGPVNFSLFDINDDGFGSWLDKIVVSGTNSAGAAVNVSKVGTLCIQTGGTFSGNNTTQLTLNSGSSTSCTCWGNNEVNVGTGSDCISTVVIKYQSGNTTYNNPKQYVIISNLKAFIPAAVAAPTSITGTTTICAGASTTLTAVGGSATSQWYTGSCGGTLVGTGASITVSPSSSTTYFVRNGATSCSPASACISAIVTVNPAPATPTISASGPTTFCSGGSVTLTSSAATGNTWSTGATTQSITVSTAGTYTVTNIASGCSSTSAGTTVTINSTPTTPTISASGPTTFCSGGNVTLTSSAASGNTWSTGATTQSITVSNAGSYTVTTTSNGCTSATSAAITVTINPTPATPTISVSGPTTFCSGGSVTLTSSAIIGNTWSTSATTQSITVSSSGTYTVTVGTAGCTATSTGTTVTVNPTPSTPTISANGPTTFCPGGSVTLTSISTTGNLWSTGATTQSITVSNAGTYTLTYTDANGCVSASASQIVTVNSTTTTPTISASGPTTFCSGGSVTLTSSELTGNTWSTGATTQSITVSSSGTYTVTVGSSGCTATSIGTTVTVNPTPNTPTISANGPTTFCPGGNVTLTSSSTIGNTWSTGETTQSITVSTSGTYTLTFTDANGCVSASASQIVTVNSTTTTPTISASGPTTFCSGGSVTLTSSAASGNTWSTGATTQSISVSSSGTYTVTVGSAGCSATSAGTTVTVNPTPNTPTISASGPISFCSGGSVTLTSSSATGNIWSTIETTQSIIVSTSGTYTLTFTDANGCVSSSVSQIVAVNSNPTTPTISPNDPTTFCVGDSVILTSSATSGNVWNTGATTQSITVLTAGTYSVTVGSVGCSATSASVGVTQNPLPVTPTITASQTTLCTGQTATLTSNVSTGNTWSTGASTSSISVSNAGTFTLFITDVNGCISPIASIVISSSPIPSAPTISASGPTTFCAGGNVILSSNIATGNTWSTGATSQSITVTNSGTYTVSYTNAAGCISSVASQLVTVNPLPTTPTISAGGPLTICSGSTVTLTSSATTGNTWSNGATTQSITVGTAGTYSVTVTASGCSTTSNSVTIVLNTAPNAPTISASSTSLCPGQTTTLTSSATTGNTWSTGATTQAITVSTAGTYTVQYTNANGCNSANASVTITANTPPSVSVNSSTICQSQSATLTATASPSGGTYTWTPGGNTSSTLTISPNTTSTYNVVYQLNGCTSAPASGTVTVNAAPVVTFLANQVSGCSPLTVQFNNTTSGNPTNCQWSFSNGASAVGCQSTYTFTNSGCYDVTLTNTVGGCTVSQTLADYVCVTSPPIASFSMNPNEFTASPQNVTFYNNSSGATSYLWNFVDGSTSSVMNPSHIFNNTQAGYMVSLTATNADGCFDVYQIGIGYVDGVEYYIPNTFTPDGDGYNQTFQPIFTSGYDPYNFHMMIFNRWGELIFESFDASQGWDGSYGLKGRPAEDGIYTYKIVFKNPKVDDRIIVSGHVTLIR